MPSVAIVAGDASGDVYGALLAEELRAAVPGLELFGAGGARMKAAGVRLEADLSLASAIGVVESARVAPALVIAFLHLRSLLARRRPDALTLIDFGAFNRRLGRFAKNIGVRTAYLIPPGSWRRSDRGARRTAQCADLFLSPFTWSAENLLAAGAKAHYVGHPLLDIARAKIGREEFLAELGADRRSRHIALLPGSRKHEVVHILPVFLDAAAVVSAGVERALFTIAAAPSVADLAARVVDAWNKRKPGTCVAPRVLVDRTYDVLASAEVALIASGTATLEAAIIGTPMVIVYRGSAAMTAERFLRRGVLGRHIGLPNIIAGCEICPEVLGKEATGERIGAEAIRLLGDPSLQEETKCKLNNVRSQLGQPGAIRRSAMLIAQMAGLQAQS